MFSLSLRRMHTFPAENKAQMLQSVTFQQKQLIIIYHINEFMVKSLAIQKRGTDS